MTGDSYLVFLSNRNFDESISKKKKKQRERETAKLFGTRKKTEMEKTKIFTTNILNVIYV